MARSMMVRNVVAVAAALGALTVAFIAGTGSAATATQGQPVIAGQINDETSPTQINNTSVDATTGMVVNKFGSDTSATALAVTGPNGIAAVSNASGAVNGVFGRATNAATGSGVYGQNDSTGYGVAGRSNNGTGVLADSSNGTALSVTGKAKFSRSGVATVSAGQTYKQVTLTGLTSSTFVVATVQGSTAGVWVQRVAVTPASGYFRIYLNKTASANTKVGWFAIN